jgi:copper resistance protein D
MLWLSTVTGLDAWTSLRILVAAGVYLAALSTIGSHLFQSAFAGLPSSERQRIARSGAWMAVAGSTLVLLQWPLQAGYLGGGLQAAFDPMLLGMVHDGPQGTRLHMLLGGFALLLVAAASQRRLGDAGRWLGLLGIAFVLLGFAQVGHTRGEPRLALATLLALHLLTAGFWLAALAPLYRMAGDATQPRLAALTLRRFGQIGLLFVPLLLAAGSGLAWLLLGGLAPLFSTAYGQLLLGKIALIALLLMLAALNKLRLVPAIEAGDPHAARSLRRSIVAEMAVVAIIVLATALLTTTSSPHDELAGTGSGRARMFVDPARLPVVELRCLVCAERDVPLLTSDRHELIGHAQVSPLLPGCSRA